jgi:hypothetical protein
MPIFAERDLPSMATLLFLWIFAFSRAIMIAIACYWLPLPAAQFRVSIFIAIHAYHIRHGQAC